jgi:O-antigen/teichoic acid export membrane protein
MGADTIPGAQSYPMSKTAWIPTDIPGLLGALGRGTLWIWLDRGLMPLVTWILGVFLIRYLGPSEFGVYSTALSTGMLVAIATDLGMTKYAAREVAFAPSNGRTILAIGIAVAFVLTFMELTLLGVSVLLDQPFMVALALGLVLGSCDKFNDLTAAVLRAEFRNREMFISSFAGRLSRLILMGVAVWQQIPVQLVLAGMAASTLPVMGIRLIQLKHFDFLRSWKTPEWPLLSRSLKSAWPFFSYSVAEVAYTYLQVPILSLVSGTEETGLFASAFILASVLPQWACTLNDAMLPLMTRLYSEKNIQFLIDMRDRVMRVLLIVSLAVGVSLFVVAPDVCGLFGEKYVSCAPVLRVLSICCILWVLEGYLGGVFLTAIDFVRERRNIVALSVGVRAVLTFALAPQFGAVGAAVASAIASTFTVLRYVRACAEAGMPLKIGWTPIKYTTAAFGSGLMAFALKPSTGAVGAFLMVQVFYAAMLVLSARKETIATLVTVRQFVTGRQ